MRWAKVDQTVRAEDLLHTNPFYTCILSGGGFMNKTMSCMRGRIGHLEDILRIAEDIFCQEIMHIAVRFMQGKIFDTRAATFLLQNVDSTKQEESVPSL